VAGAQSKRQSRKRRRTAAAAKAPAAAARPRSAREAATRRPNQQSALSTTLTGRTYGDPPANPFGGVPVSEVAILVGAVGVVVGLVAKAAPALIVGVVVVTLGVAEFSAREHFSGYRSHTTLLAGIPAVAIGVVLIALLGGSLDRSTLLFVVLPVFLILAWFLRRRFRAARQGRIVRPPAP
jgi:hypothetical protein